MEGERSRRQQRAHWSSASRGGDRGGARPRGHEEGGGGREATRAAARKELTEAVRRARRATSGFVADAANAREAEAAAERQRPASLCARIEARTRGVSSARDAELDAKAEAAAAATVAAYLTTALAEQRGSGGARALARGWRPRWCPARGLPLGVQRLRGGTCGGGGAEELVGRASRGSMAGAAKRLLHGARRGGGGARGGSSPSARPRSRRARRRVSA